MVMDLLDPLTSHGGMDDAQRQTVLDDVIDTVNREFAGTVLRSPNESEREHVNVHIRSQVANAFRVHGLPPSSAEQGKLAEEIARRVMGLGFLDLLLPPARADLSEIAIYSSGLVQVMKKGNVRWEDANVDVDASEVWRVLNLILGPQSRSVNEATPSVNAKLPATRHNPGGGRVKVLHPAIAPGNGYPSVNIRLFEQKPVLPAWLLERNVMSSEMMEFLAEAMQSGKRILISGATRTGKTTLLSALCNFLPPAWRIVKIEDPEEIWIDRKTVQAVEARPKVPGSEVPAYTLADGVDDAMRMSPDYLIVGEVRDGRAAMALLRALMTGHAGACTLHADSPREAFERLTTLMGSDMGVSPRDAARMISASVDILVQIGIVHEARRLTSIARVDKKLHGGEAWFIPIWRYEESHNEVNGQWMHVENRELVE
ncbi:MAG: CpaF family protein [Anaerolineales bacterium]|nr:CpaF family protein [Anaerolineales bacterium]